MEPQEAEQQQYIDHRVRHALSRNALARIKRIVDRFEADERRSRIAVYVFFLLFVAIALWLSNGFSHKPPARTLKQAYDVPAAQIDNGARSDSTQTQP